MSTFSLGVVGDTEINLARVTEGRPFTISISKTFVNIVVQARTNFASVGSSVLETIRIHLSINTQSRGVSTLAFLTRRISISATSLFVPAAEILGEAGIFVSDKAVRRTALEVSPLVPDTRRILLAISFLGVATDLAFTTVGRGDPVAVITVLAGSLLTTEFSTSSFLAHTLGKRIAVLGRALGSTFFKLTVGTSNTSTNKSFRDFIATHLPAASFSETLGRGSLVVEAVSIRVTEAVRKTIARKNDVGVNSSFRRENRVDVIEGVAHTVEEHGIEVINTDRLEVFGRLVVDELGESDESVLIGIKSGTNNIDVITLKILDNIAVFPTDLATSNEDNNLVAVRREFVEHSLGLRDGRVNNHEVRRVDVVTEELEFSRQGGVDVGELAVRAEMRSVVITSLKNTKTETSSSTVSTTKRSGPRSSLSPAIDHSSDASERVHLTAHRFNHSQRRVNDEDDIRVVARSEASVLALGTIPVAEIILITITRGSVFITALNTALGIIPLAVGVSSTSTRSSVRSTRTSSTSTGRFSILPPALVVIGTVELRTVVGTSVFNFTVSGLPLAKRIVATLGRVVVATSIFIASIHSSTSTIDHLTDVGLITFFLG